ncbi:MAG: WG repeat-containing protein [Bacteroides sp.]|nr:WG repeat-containing protein [Bacteroides sp.]
MNKYLSLCIGTLFGFHFMLAADLQPEQNAKGKWGFVDSTGTPVVDYKYDAVVPFDGNYAKICKNQKWGYVNRSGTEVLKPEYQEITDFADGIARVMKGNKYGFINEKMEFIIPCKFTAVGAFNANDLIWVADGNQYGIYRKDGKVFIEPKFKKIGIFEPYERVFKKSDFEKSSYVYTSHYRLNGSHHLLRKSSFDCTPFSKIPENPVGFFCSNDIQTYNNAVITPEGQTLIQHNKYHAPFYPTEGIMLVSKGNNKYNYIDLATDRWLLSKDVADGWAFNGDVAIIKHKVGKTYKYQFIDKQGKPISDATYDEIFPRVNNVYITLRNNRYGMCDANGKEIIVPSYKAIISTTGNYFAAQQNEGDLYGFLDNRGQWAIKPTYSTIAAEPNGYHCVKKDGKWGAIDRSGVEIVGCDWDNIITPTEAEQKIIWVATGTGENKRYKAYSVNDHKIAFQGEYKGVWNFDTHFPEIALVHNGTGKYGCIDSKGAVIIPLELTNSDLVKDGYKMLMQRDLKTWRPIDTHRILLGSLAKNNTYRLSQKLDNNQWEY